MYEVIIVSLTLMLMLVVPTVIVVGSVGYTVQYALNNIKKEKALMHTHAPSFTVFNKIK